MRHVPGVLAYILIGILLSAGFYLAHTGWHWHSGVVFTTVWLWGLAGAGCILDHIKGVRHAMVLKGTVGWVTTGVLLGGIIGLFIGAPAILTPLDLLVVHLTGYGAGALFYLLDIYKNLPQSDS